MILIDCVKARMKTTEFQPKPIKYGISNDIFWNFRILLPSDQWRRGGHINPPTNRQFECLSVFFTNVTIGAEIVNQARARLRWCWES